MSNKMMDEFESWWRSLGYLVFRKDHYGRYSFEHTETAWQAWKASRNSLAVELPAYFSEDTKKYRDVLVYRLDEAGVSYK